MTTTAAIDNDILLLFNQLVQSVIVVDKLHPKCDKYIWNIIMDNDEELRTLLSAFIDYHKTNGMLPDIVSSSHIFMQILDILYDMYASLENGNYHTLNSCLDDLYTLQHGTTRPRNYDNDNDDDDDC
jgi:hypothetical protein